MDYLDFGKFLTYTRKIHDYIKKELNNAVREYQISNTHIQLLLVLGNYEEGISMHMLSELMYVDNALVTRSIKDLEQLGFLFRNRKTVKERKYRICLTEKGQKLKVHLEEVTNKIWNNLKSHFTDEELSLMRQTVKILEYKYDEIIEREKIC